jgi:flagellar hook assembly protein FlgD
MIKKSIKYYSLSIIIFILGGFISCKNCRNSGTINIKVTDENNHAVVGAGVNIYSNSSGYIKIISDSTDISGRYTGKLLEGEYAYSVYKRRDKMLYSEEAFFQVITCDYRSFKINPFLNIQ